MLSVLMGGLVMYALVSSWLVVRDDHNKWQATGALAFVFLASLVMSAGVSHFFYLWQQSGHN